MIVKLSSAEKKTLSALDPKASGNKPWQTAREVGGGVFRKKPENLDQEEIRVVRNAFRKLVRESLVEMNGSDRGQYRISERGRKLLAAGMPNFESKFQRGEATQAAKDAGEARMKARPKKAPSKKTAAKPAAKKTPPKKTKPAAKAKPASKKPAAKAKPKAEPKKEAPKAEAPKAEAKAEGSNGTHKKPQFKRRQALLVANKQAPAEAEG